MNFLALFVTLICAVEAGINREILTKAKIEGRKFTCPNGMEKLDHFEHICVPECPKVFGGKTIRHCNRKEKKIHQRRFLYYHLSMNWSNDELMRK
ncbi:Oidioi.mRNA.OKI2018_I69.XSR.g16066.t1.cds [Oikopleura dioica]|uniref:Oidioi.mRNA.OKI2018_I69.XSR.g16066.t1.cds n=1 Tax=Oikopleura dioica TaxID=34765 RepID=A0ABN7SK06_OIKDI|nr:Oidioi.mRNA.OKI2018_I69.XSR.g16066.t1.cds [Oikopleura dioica]